jgi:hypothetical protein
MAAILDTYSDMEWMFEGVFPTDIDVRLIRKCVATQIKVTRALRRV